MSAHTRCNWCLNEGPRGCGKTETAGQAANSEVRLDIDDDAWAAGLLAPQVLLDGDRPRLIDGWQLIPAIWNHVRRAVDAGGGRPGQFILTGSALPADDTTRHSGALRISRLPMRPMSLVGRGALGLVQAGDGDTAPTQGSIVGGTKAPLKARRRLSAIGLQDIAQLRQRHHHPHRAADPNRRPRRSG